MTQIRYLPRALEDLDEIYLYTLETWGENQADEYLGGLFQICEELNQKLSKAIPAEFEVDGYVKRYKRHFIYWRKSKDGSIIVVCVLHERMHQEWQIAEIDFGTE